MNKFLAKRLQCLGWGIIAGAVLGEFAFFQELIFHSIIDGPMLIAVSFLAFFGILAVRVGRHYDHV